MSGAPLLETVPVALPPNETDDESLTDVVRSFACCPILRDLEVQIDADRHVYVDENVSIVYRLRLREDCKLERVLVEYIDYLHYPVDPLDDLDD